MADYSPAESQAWRAAAADALECAGFGRDAADFRNCQAEYLVDVCERDIDHQPIAKPKTCHKRYCPPCEAREQARKLARYVPAMRDMASLDVDGYRLRKIEFTTPLALSDPEAPKNYENGWKWLSSAFQALFWDILDWRGELTRAEKRRGRIDLKKHDIGALCSCEFGERGRKQHFHCIVYSPFVAKYKLSAAWKAASGGRCEVTWIKEVQSEGVDDMVADTLKYVTKFQGLVPAEVPALARVLDGRRRLRTLGRFYAAEVPEKVPYCCDECGSGRARISPTQYIAICETSKKRPDDSVLESVESLLDLRYGNKSGEK